jgi:hypothetical protein
VIDSISVQAAAERDRSDLARFICGPGDEPFVAEVQTYIRERSLDDVLLPQDPDEDRRLLVVRGEPGHRLVAVASHSANHRVVDEAGDVVPGTELTLLAVSLAVQGDRIDGRSLFRLVLEAVVGDVIERDRGSLLAFLVHEANDKMLAIVRSSGGFEERIMSSGHIAFLGTV